MYIYSICIYIQYMYIQYMYLQYMYIYIQRMGLTCQKKKSHINTNLKKHMVKGPDQLLTCLQQNLEAAALNIAHTHTHVCVCARALCCYLFFFLPISESKANRRLKHLEDPLPFKILNTPLFIKRSSNVCGLQLVINKNNDDDTNNNNSTTIINNNNNNGIMGLQKSSLSAEIETVMVEDYLSGQPQRVAETCKLWTWPLLWHSGSVYLILSERLYIVRELNIPVVSMATGANITVGDVVLILSPPSSSLRLL